MPLAAHRGLTLGIMEMKMDPMHPDSKDKARELDNVLAAQVAETAKMGHPTPVDPDTAEILGAFEDDALSHQDALDSRFDAPRKGTGA